jgi:hypothetical protein
MFKKTTLAMLFGRSAGLPLSDWYVTTEPYGSVPQQDTSNWLRDRQVIAMRVIDVEHEKLTCLEYPSPYDPPLHGEEPRFFVRCAGSDRLGATLMGDREDIQVFYRMLGAIKRR